MKSNFCILDLTLDETENELIDTFSIGVGCFTDNLSVPFWNGQVYPVVCPLVVFIVVLDGIRLILVSHNLTTKLRFSHNTDHVDCVSVPVAFETTARLSSTRLQISGANSYNLAALASAIPVC